MPFLGSLQTGQIFFYLTVVCNLATCSSSGSGGGGGGGVGGGSGAFNTTVGRTLDDGMRLVTDCRYAYPHYVTPYVISCSNVFVHQIPLHDNVTKMELVNVPLTVLNDTLIPRAIQSDRVSLRQLHWTKSHITLVEKVPIPHLNELDLSWNIIREIRPNAVRQLVDLKKLNVSRNNITHLPSNLFDERNSIAVLSLSHNQLKTLPHTIFETLKRLEILDLSNNQLSQLSETLFKRNTRLQNLDLSHNKLSALPLKIFASLASLRYLSLEDNHLYVLEPDTFQHQHELMVLNLGKNPLWSLPSVLLPNNNTLFILTISHTHLGKVKLTALQNLRSLASLHLTNNLELQNLPVDTFQNLRNLHTISLENNRFTQLPTSILDTKPADLYLDGNPWPCDCSVQWIAYWVVHSVNGGRQGSLHLDAAKCNGTDQDLLEALFQLPCKPNIVRVTPHSYQKLDSSVRLTCRAYSNPPAFVRWLTPHGPASTTPPTQPEDDANEFAALFPSETVLVSDNVKLYDNGDLDIVRMSREDAGEYTCVASNNLGESHALTRVYADPSIMERIKVGSIICGLLWVNTFIIFSALYLLIRKYSKRTKREKRTERMQKNMDVYKSQQISRLRERCRNQMNRIKNNCSIQVDWMKENYKESISNTQDHSTSCLTNQYNEQMAEIREYYLKQMHEVREHYNQQRNLILEFNLDRIGDEEAAAAAVTAKVRHSVDETLMVRVENGSAPPPPNVGPSTSSTSSSEEEEIYKYNDTMKNEIQTLTSLRNLHAIWTEATNRSRNGAFHPSSANFQHAPATDSVVSNGRIPQRMPEDEGDESTSMLSSVR